MHFLQIDCTSSHLQLGKVSNFFIETLIFGDLFLKKAINFRGAGALARGKNGGTRTGKNNGVRRISLFYSSLGAGYAPCDARKTQKYN
jgi:hypothetical protein